LAGRSVKLRIFGKMDFVYTLLSIRRNPDAFFGGFFVLSHLFSIVLLDFIIIFMYQQIEIKDCLEIITFFLIKE